MTPSEVTAAAVAVGLPSADELLRRADHEMYRRRRGQVAARGVVVYVDNEAAGTIGGRRRG